MKKRDVMTLNKKDIKKYTKLFAVASIIGCSMIGGLAQAEDMTVDSDVTLTSDTTVGALNIDKRGSLKLQNASVIANSIKTAAGTKLYYSGSSATTNRVTTGTLDNAAKKFKTSVLTVTGSATNSGLIEIAPAADCEVHSAIKNFVNSGSGTKLTISKDAIVDLTTAENSNYAQIANYGTLNASGLNNQYKIVQGDATKGLGLLTLTGTNKNSGTITQGKLINNGSLLNTGTITILGDETNTSDNKNSGSRTITNKGTMNLTDFTNNGIIEGTGDMVISGTNTTFNKNDGNGTITQNSITISEGAVYTNNGSISAAITNNGTISGNNGALTLTGDSSNASSHSITQQSITINNGIGLENNGTISAAITNNGTITGDNGTLTLTGTSTNASGHSITQKDLTVNQGITLTNNGNIELKGLLTNNATSKIIGTGNLKLDASSGNSVNDGEISQNILTVESGATLYNRNKIKSKEVVNSGTINNNGANGVLETIKLTNNTGASLKQKTIIVTNSALNTGTIEIAGDTNSVKSEIYNLTNKDSGILTIHETATLDLTTAENKDSAQIRNYGTLNASGVTNSSIITSGTHSAGTLNLSGTNSNTGSIDQYVIENKSGKLTNNDNGTITAKTSLTNDSGAKIINDNSIQTVGLDNKSGAEISGTGTLSVTGAGNNEGSITQGRINATGTNFKNTGSITLTKKSKTESSTINQLDNNGANALITINNGAILHLTNETTSDKNAHNRKGATITNYGTLYVDTPNGTGGNELINESTINGTGDLIVSEGKQLSNTGDGTIAQTNMVVDGLLKNENTVTINKKLYVSSSGEIQNNKGSFSTKTLENKGKIKQAIIEVTDSANNTGSIILEADSTKYPDGTDTSSIQNLNNHENASLEVSNNITVALKDAVNKDTAQIKNYGTVNAENLNNSSTIKGNATKGWGTLNLKGTTKNSGKITQGIIKNLADSIINNTGDIEAKTSLTNNGDINSTLKADGTNSTITAATLINDDHEINLSGADLSVTAQSQDSAIDGTINVSNDALANEGDKSSISFIGKSGQENSYTGILTVVLSVDDSKPKTVLDIIAGDIDGQTAINAGTVVNLTNDATKEVQGKLTIDSENDTFGGDINIAGGKLTLKDISDLTIGTEQTTKDSVLPYLTMKTSSGKNSTLELVGTKLTMSDSSQIEGGDLIVDNNSVYTSLKNAFTTDNLTTSGLIEAINGDYENYTMKQNFNIGSDTDDQADFTIDVYGRSQSNNNADRFLATGDLSTTLTNAKVNVSDWKLNGDLFGKDAPIDKVINLGQIFDGATVDDKVLFDATKKKTMTAIGNYQLQSMGGGAYSLGLTDFNPKAYRGQASTLAMYANQINIDDIVTQHFIMHDPQAAYSANNMSNQNRYAISDAIYSPYQSHSLEEGGLWVKNYVDFETLSLTHNINVHNTAYGNIIGADLPLVNLKRGWKYIPTAYVGYNGANQSYSGISMYQNGGQGGFMSTFMKNDFKVSILGYVGGYHNEIKIAGDTDRTNNWFAGAATRLAYNLHATKHFTIQPMVFASYNVFGKQRWHSDFGAMTMNSGYLNGVNVAPGLNLVYTRDTWSVYTTFQYAYNINDQVSGRAGNVDINNLEMKHGYFQYGIGATKTWKDRLKSYIQIVLRNGGRTGIGFQLGCRYAFGKDRKTVDKVQKNKPLTIKQLSVKDKARLTKN